VLLRLQGASHADKACEQIVRAFFVAPAGNEILGIVIAALGGAAVGVDRQRANSRDEAGAIGGIRTFTLLGTVAGTCGFLIVHRFTALGVVILASAAVVVMLVRLGAGRSRVTQQQKLQLWLSWPAASLRELVILSKDPRRVAELINPAFPNHARAKVVRNWAATKIKAR
jgi:hypothetical protein